jgi:hypothetical protein
VDVILNTATRKSAPADPADDLHRSAFNAAFSELNLKWHWDPDTYREFGRLPTDKERIRAYLEARQAHLLDSYDLEFLVDAIYAAKVRWYSMMTVTHHGDPHDDALVDTRVPAARR